MSRLIVPRSEDSGYGDWNWLVPLGKSGIRSVAGNLSSFCLVVAGCDLWEIGSCGWYVTNGQSSLVPLRVEARKVRSSWPAG
ncbi:hypothetical protein kuro4_09360 [Gelria sp. Kuro-4]|nr:hypothetical protein kuro4_09360 [Gelria sp. Kuro-4]